MRARIYRSAARVFECKLCETGEMVSATALGNLLKDGELVVGDYVELEFGQESDPVIQSVEKRENEIYRVLVRESKRKVSAANCQLLVIVMSVSRPQFKRGLLDRYLLRSIQWNIPAIVVFNKMDEHNPKKLDLPFEADRIKPLVEDVFEICGKFPDYKPQYFEKGFEALKHCLEKRTALFLGQSGVGKSRTITSLTGGEVELKSKKVGKVGKGAHTTTWTEIIEHGDFILVDSPGVRSFSVDDMLEETLENYFPDLCEYIPNCQFADCEHLENSKGCTFREDLSLEKYQDRLILSRLESFLRFKEELQKTPSWKKKY